MLPSLVNDVNERSRLPFEKPNRAPSSMDPGGTKLFEGAPQGSDHRPDRHRPRHFDHSIDRTSVLSSGTWDPGAPSGKSCFLTMTAIPLTNPIYGHAPT